MTNENSLTATEAIARVRTLAEDLEARRGNPYETGWEIWKTAMAGSEDDSSIDGDHCHLLWLAFGALMDEVKDNPDDAANAMRAMLGAASAWLPLSEDELSWRPFLEELVAELYI
ncbi:MAG: hypothetical protein JHD02_06345 [Thermoleophilaceae bacterium]|nr:hypothetical protein [Thermoleophilaceae bacterium]